MSTNLNATQKRERALKALANVHPTHLSSRSVRPGSPVARAIKVATERHTQALTEIQRVQQAAQRARDAQTQRILDAIFGPEAPANRQDCPQCGGECEK